MANPQRSGLELWPAEGRQVNAHSRFAGSALLLRMRPTPVLPGLAGLMALGCLLVPLARSPGSAIELFALAGAGCSAVLPLTFAPMPCRV